MATTHTNQGSRLAKAFADVVDGFVYWRIWYLLGLHEIRQRYRRSTIGALWVTVTIGVQAIIFGYLLGYLFDQKMEKFLPYVTCGLVVWGYLTSAINESTGAFAGQGSIILQVKRPLSVYILQIVWRNIIVFFHSIIVFFIVAPIKGIYPSFEYLWFIPGFLILSANIAWMCLVAALLAARFRDIQLLVANALQILTWLTPILYYRSQLGGSRALIIDLNPFTYLVEIVRSPLMNEPVSLFTWSAAILTTFVGWGLTLLLFARVRSRVPYWV